MIVIKPDLFHFFVLPSKTRITYSVTTTRQDSGGGNSACENPMNKYVFGTLRPLEHVLALTVGDQMCLLIAPAFESNRRGQHKCVGLPNKLLTPIALGPNPPIAVFAHTVEPMPNWPQELPPQHFNEPSSSTAQVWPPLAETETTVLPLPKFTPDACGARTVAVEPFQAHHTGSSPAFQRTSSSVAQVWLPLFETDTAVDPLPRKQPVVF